MEAVDTLVLSPEGLGLYFLSSVTVRGSREHSSLFFQGAGLNHLQSVIAVGAVNTQVCLPKGLDFHYQQNVIVRGRM